MVVDITNTFLFPGDSATTPMEFFLSVSTFILHLAKRGTAVWFTAYFPGADHHSDVAGLSPF